MSRTSGKGWCAAGVVLGLAMQVVVAPCARAQGGQPSDIRGSLVVVAEQEMSGVDIELRVETLSGRTLRNGRLGSGEALRIGDRVQICFLVSQPGYISLWSQDGTAQAEQIYPNQYASGAGRVDETEQCLGTQGAGFAFQVEGPPGDSLVFLHYSRDETEQISQEDFPVIRRVRSADDQAPYASSSVTFRIVE